jgi:endoglucanase
MKQLSKAFLYLLTLLFISCSENSVVEVSEIIRINTLGYTPTGNKIATIVAPECGKIVIKNASDHKKVFEANSTGPFSQIDTSLVLWKADFSDFEEEGKFYIEVPGVGRSIDFSISDDVYTFPCYTSMRAFYLWRCGTEVFGVHNGDTFKHAACHLDDGYLDYTEFGEETKDGIGGWPDAGDYGKYVTNAGITVANLLFAWEHYSNKIKNVPLDLPETATDLPEFLQEIKWETDYLMKMEYPDGSGRVFHKLTRTNFSAFIMPEEDETKRYFTEWGSNAVANFTAVMAMASRVFEPYIPEYAQECLNAAQRGYQFLDANPEYTKWEQKEFKTGAYRTHDKYARIWAASELWETTGDDKYLKDFEERALQFEEKIDLNWDWDTLKNLGMFTYLLSDKPGKNPEIFSSIKSELLEVANKIVDNTQNDAFGRPFDMYYWGCNGTVARLATTLGVANKLEPNDKFEYAANDITAHLFGRNYYSRSFVTGLGLNPPMFPHARRCGADDVDAPWPGYLVGGGHTPTDWVD